MIGKEEFKKVKDFIDAEESILVTAHILPDADAVGSSVAFLHLMRKLEKRSAIVFPSAPPRRLEFLFGSLPVYCYPEVDPSLWQSFTSLVVLDSSDWSRLGPLKEPFGEHFKKVLAIDHHPGHKSFSSVSIVKPWAAAAARIVFELIRLFDVSLSRDMSEALMTALKGDTASFSYPSTNEDTFLMASELMKAGCRLNRINGELCERFTLQGISFIAEALTFIETRCKGKVGFLRLPRPLFRKHSASIDDAFPLLSYVRGVRGVRVAVVLYEDELGEVKTSFRSNDGIDVGSIARSFGGGGHRAAAGALIKASLSEVENLVLTRVEAAIDEEEDAL